MSDKKFLDIHIGRKIKKYRDDKGLSQDDLAKMLNVTRTSVVNYENGKQSFYISTIYNLAQALSVQIMDLLPTLTEYIEANAITKKYSKKSPNSEIPPDILNFIITSKKEK